MRRITLSHRIQHLLLLGVSRVVRFLPERSALGIGSALGWIAGSVLRVRRSVVLENLGRAFPERDERWRRRIASASYRHLAREAVFLLRLPSMDRDALIGRCQVEGLELVRKALESGRGAVILTGHFGNWELGGSAIAAHGVPLDIVARAQTNPLFDEYLERTRQVHGLRVIYREDAPGRILRSLRESRAVALAADQNVSRGGIFVDFFGHPAATARGPALLSKRARAPAFVALVRRLEGHLARYRITFEPLAAPEASEGREESVRFLSRYLSALEAAVRDAPEQYFWMHRRWKTRPGEEVQRLDEEAPPPDEESPLPNEEAPRRTRNRPRRSW